MSDTKYVSTGPGFLTLLTILFIGLKLGHVVTWPWLWVLAPIWIPIAVTLGLIAIISIIALLVILVKAAL